MCCFELLKCKCLHSISPNHDTTTTTSPTIHSMWLLNNKRLFTQLKNQLILTRRKAGFLLAVHRASCYKHVTVQRRFCLIQNPLEHVNNIKLLTCSRSPNHDTTTTTTKKHVKTWNVFCFLQSTDCSNLKSRDFCSEGFWFWPKLKAVLKQMMEFCVHKWSANPGDCDLQP